MKDETKPLEPDAIWDRNGRLVYLNLDKAPHGFAHGFRRGFEDATRDFVQRNEARHQRMEALRREMKWLDELVRTKRIILGDDFWRYGRILREDAIFKNPDS